MTANTRISIARMFEPAYKNFCESRLLPDEPVFAAVNFALSRTFGLYIITSYRVFRVCCIADRQRKYIHYQTTGPKGSAGVRFEINWYPDLDTYDYLTQRESKGLVILEALLSEIRSCNPADYVCEYRGKQIPLTGILLGGRQEYTFTRDDGRYIYQLIQKAIRAGGRLEQVIEPVTQETSKESHNPTELLAQLASLKDADILTQAEFEDAKARILKRL